MQNYRQLFAKLLFLCYYELVPFYRRVMAREDSPASTFIKEEARE